MCSPTRTRLRSRLIPVTPTPDSTVARSGMGTGTFVAVKSTGVSRPDVVELIWNGNVKLIWFEVTTCKTKSTFVPHAKFWDVLMRNGTVDVPLAPGDKSGNTRTTGSTKT